MKFPGFALNFIACHSKNVLEAALEVINNEQNEDSMDCDDENGIKI